MACDTALELDDKNVKALYRRAEARVRRGSGGTSVTATGEDGTEYVGDAVSRSGNPLLDLQAHLVAYHILS